MPSDARRAGPRVASPTIKPDIDQGGVPNSAPRVTTRCGTNGVASQVVDEAEPGLWVRVKRVLLPNGEEVPTHEESVYFLRWELVTTAELYDALPVTCGRSGEAEDPGASSASKRTQRPAFPHRRRPYQPRPRSSRFAVRVGVTRNKDR